MDKNKKILGISIMVILIGLSLSVYSQEQDPIQKKIKEFVDGIKSDKDFTAQQNNILAILKAKGIDSLPEVKVLLRTKHEELAKKGQIEYLDNWNRQYFTLNEGQIKALNPKEIEKWEKTFTLQKVELDTLGTEQFEAYTGRKGTGMSTGTKLGWGGLTLLLVGGALIFAFANPKYRIGRKAKKIMDAQKQSMRLKRKEELNIASIGKVEGEKKKLIEDNVKQSKELEDSEGDIRRLNRELRSKKGWSGVYDKRLLEDYVTVNYLAEFVGKEDAEKILKMARGEIAPVARELERIIAKIRHENKNLWKLIEKEVVLDNKIMGELLIGKKEFDVSRINLEKIRDFIERNEESIKLTGKERRAIGLIKKEKDIETIVQKGKETAQKTLIAVHEFQQITQHFDRFKHNIDKQNLLLDAEEKALKTKDAEEVENRAEDIKKSFEEETRFYRYLESKEGEILVEVLREFGKMKDITRLSGVMRGMGETTLKLEKTERDVDEIYKGLENFKRTHKLSESQVSEINKLQRRVDENERALNDVIKGSTQSEAFVHSIIGKISGIADIKEEEREDEEKEITNGIKQAERHEGEDKKRADEVESEKKRINKEADDVMNRWEERRGGEK